MSKDRSYVKVNKSCFLLLCTEGTSSLLLPHSLDRRPFTTYHASRYPIRCNHQILVLIGSFSIFGRKHEVSSSFVFVTVNEADLVRVRRAKTVDAK